MLCPLLTCIIIAQVKKKIQNKMQHWAENTWRRNLQTHWSLIEQLLRIELAYSLEIRVQTRHDRKVLIRKSATLLWNMECCNSKKHKQCFNILFHSPHFFHSYITSNNRWTNMDQGLFGMLKRKVSAGNPVGTTMMLINTLSWNYLYSIFHTNKQPLHMCRVCSSTLSSVWYFMLQAKHPSTHRPEWKLQMLL